MSAPDALKSLRIAPAVPEAIHPSIRLAHCMIDRALRDARGGPNITKQDQANARAWLLDGRRKHRACSSGWCFDVLGISARAAREALCRRW